MTAHRYAAQLHWQGSTGVGLRDYDRAHTGTTPPAGTEFALSADPAFRGTGDRTNPEQLLLLAASSCQLLSFLAVAAARGVDVLSYADEASAVMDDAAAPARITSIRLAPRIEVGGDTTDDEVRRLAELAHQGCFVANTLTCETTLEVTVARR